MNKYLKFLFVALFATISFSFSSCGDDDDDEPKLPSATITINGVEKEISLFVGMMGEWDSDNDDGHFTVSIYEDPDVSYYTFFYENTTFPKVGDNFAKMNLQLMVMDDSDLSMLTRLNYVSGSAVVKSLNKNDGSITIQFSNLKMQKNDYTYVFNGVAPVPFDFD